MYSANFLFIIFFYTCGYTVNYKNDNTTYIKTLYQHKVSKSIIAEYENRDKNYNKLRYALLQTATCNISHDVSFNVKLVILSSE